MPKKEINLHGGPNGTKHTRLTAQNVADLMASYGVSADDIRETLAKIAEVTPLIGDAADKATIVRQLSILGIEARVAVRDGVATIACGKQDAGTVIEYVEPLYGACTFRLNERTETQLTFTKAV